MLTINISKAEREVEVDFDALPAQSREYIIKYGLTQALNDAHASISAKADGAGAMAWGLAIKKLDAIRAGTVGMRQGRVGDPVRARAIVIATPYAKAALVKMAAAAANAGDPGAEAAAEKAKDAAAVRAKAVELVKANPAYMHLAEKQLAEERELGLGIDLGEGAEVVE